MDLFDEIKQEVQRDSFWKLWQKYRWLIIGAIASIIIITGAINIAQYQHQKNAEAQGGQLLKALMQENKQALEALVNQQDLAAAIAQYRLAFLQEPATDTKKRTELLEKIEASNAKLPEELRDLAFLHAISSQLNDTNTSAEQKKIAAEKLQQRITAKSPWYPLALEQLLYHFYASDHQELARIQWQELQKIPTIPESMRRRVASLFKENVRENTP